MTLDVIEKGESFERPAYLPRSHPGEVFKRRVVEQSKLTIKEIAVRLCISQDYLSLFINGHVPVTIDLASRLESEFLISAAAWMNYQKAYDSYRNASDQMPSNNF